MARHKTRTCNIMLLVNYVKVRQITIKLPKLHLNYAYITPRLRQLNELPPLHYVNFR